MGFENYVYKKEVDWSLFNYGFAIPVEYQVVFKQIAGRFIEKGESKPITLYLNGKSYSAKIQNLNIANRHGRKTDIVQIRYCSYQYAQLITNLLPKKAKHIVFSYEDFSLCPIETKLLFMRRKECIQIGDYREICDAILEDEVIWDSSSNEH